VKCGTRNLIVDSSLVCGYAVSISTAELSFDSLNKFHLLGTRSLKVYGLLISEMFISAPGSPKSCMKGARKIAFEEKSESYEIPATVPKSPRKSAKVSIRSPGDSSSFEEKVVQPIPPPIQKPPDIQFSQHYDQSTPPPNCTSNGNYDFVEEKVDDSTESDPRNDPELVEIATKFVNEIIETAKLEAANREKVSERVPTLQS